MLVHEFPALSVGLVGEGRSWRDMDWGESDQKLEGKEKFLPNIIPSSSLV